MKTISFKVTDDEALRIRQQARKARMSLSDFLRRRAAGNGPVGSVGKITCEFTGAEILGPLTGAPPLTNESVREALTDFP